MTKRITPAAGTAPFAHLLNGAMALAGRALGKRAEEEDETIAEDETTDPDADDVDLDDVETGKKGKKGKKAEGDETDPDADDDGPDPDADEPDDEKEAKAFRAGFAAANKRAAAIFGAPAAGARPDLAAQLAFLSTQTAAEAIGFLTAAANAPAGSRLGDRMAGRSDPRPGADGGKAGGGKPTIRDRLAAAKTKAGLGA